MPNRDEYRDKEGRTFPQFVADQVMGVIVSQGKSVRQVALDSGISRTRLQKSLNNERPFNTIELSQVATALNVHPAEFVKATSFIVVGNVRMDVEAGNVIDVDVS